MNDLAPLGAADLTGCPECGMLAEIERRDVLESTDGPLEFVRIRCVRQHWFLMPVASLAGASAPLAARHENAKA